VNSSEIDSSLSQEEKAKIIQDRKNSGKIYLTAKVTRHVPEDKDGKEKTLELSEVCARMTYDKTYSKWKFDGYYNL
jgi:hypothetical protein